MMVSTFVERSISVAMGDREKVVEDIAKENELGQLDQFKQAQSEVELMIGTEAKELDVWLVSCREDMSIIGSCIHVNTCTLMYSSFYTSIQVALKSRFRITVAVWSSDFRGCREARD